jgi:hypothetical protein
MVVMMMRKQMQEESHEDGEERKHRERDKKKPQRERRNLIYEKETNDGWFCDVHQQLELSYKMRWKESTCPREWSGSQKSK